MKIIFFLLSICIPFYVFSQELFVENDEIIVKARINEINDTLYVNFNIKNIGEESIFIFYDRIYFFYIQSVIKLSAVKDNKHGNEFTNFPVPLIEIKPNEDYNENIIVMRFFEINPVLFSEIKNVDYKLFLSFHYLNYLNDIQKRNNNYIIEYNKILDNYRSLKVIYSPFY